MVCGRVKQRPRECNVKRVPQGGQVESISRYWSHEALAWPCAAVAGSQDMAGEN